MAVKRLDQLQPGDTGVVHAIRGGGNVMHRLIDMGLVKGTKISVVKYAPLGDPIEIRLKNFELALRLSEAKTIEVDVD
ncbi:MAG: ferrous iron transport protein A [Veillonella sp.]|nr:ferrous iron transport protein A [Veillonella sp.]